ncbi:hypothetical protein ACFQZC_20940 [Streptacidiphilus monticola]
MTSVDRHPPLGAPAERARALLRLPAYRRFWQVQFAGGTADRLALLVLTVLTVDAVSSESAHDVLGAATAPSSSRWPPPSVPGSPRRSFSACSRSGRSPSCCTAPTVAGCCSVLPGSARR